MELSFPETVLYIWLLASFSEELLFRGVIQGLLQPLAMYRLKFFSINIHFPALISGLFFGLMHFSLLTTGADMTFVLSMVMGAVVLGVAAGYFREKTDSI